MSDNNAPDIRKGLAGVYADYTAVSKVNPETNSLLYRGYPVQELAENCTFEEVAYLLLRGELPDDEELADFKRECWNGRSLDQKTIDMIMSMPTDCHPMDVLRSAVAFLGSYDADHFTASSNHIRWVGRQLLSKLPTIVALDIRRRRGEGYVEPRKDLGFTENFLWMVFGEIGRAHV